MTKSHCDRYQHLISSKWWSKGKTRGRLVLEIWFYERTRVKQPKNQAKQNKTKQTNKNVINFYRLLYLWLLISLYWNLHQKILIIMVLIHVQLNNTEKNKHRIQIWYKIYIIKIINTDSIQIMKQLIHTVN